MCEEYARELELLAHKLLRLILLSLGLSGADGLKGYFNDEQMSLMRLNRYPPCPSPDLVLGVGRHKDSGALTILAQDAVGGLQVRRKSDGQWIPVKPIPNAYIVNIGDVVQVCVAFFLLYNIDTYGIFSDHGYLKRMRLEEVEMTSENRMVVWFKKNN